MRRNGRPTPTQWCFSLGIPWDGPRKTAHAGLGCRYAHDRSTTVSQVEQGGGVPGDGAELAQRRAPLFPIPLGSWNGIDLDGLDPSDPGDRATLLSAEHPELGDDTDDTDDTDDELFDELLREVHLLLTERGPLAPREVAEELGVDEDELDELFGDPALVQVEGGRLASALAVCNGVTLTHRLTAGEAERRVVELGFELTPLEAFSCGEGHLHLTTGSVAALHEASSTPGLYLDEIGLPALEEGACIGFTLGAQAAELPIVEPKVLDEVPTVSDVLCARLGASFDRIGSDDVDDDVDDDGDRMPVTPLQLLCQLLADQPALVSEPLPPLGALFERAGFEFRDGHVAPAGTDWTAFERARTVARVASRRGLGLAGADVLAMLVQAAALSLGGGAGERLGRETGAALAYAMYEAELSEAFAEATEDEPGSARAFLRHLRQAGGRHHEAGLWWAESLVAGRAGEMEAAQACLRSAIASDPDHGPALADSAWYASDRGDAGVAARLLERGGDEDEWRIELLRRLSASGVPAAHVGRNDPCPCGSGRKYKQCCLARPRDAASLPIDARVGWLWEKMRWWLERFGPFDETLMVATILRGTQPPGGPVQLAAELALAASLVLFVDGAVASFIAQRASLLPADEANLAARWALGGPSVHEVGGLRPGEGFSLRDLRSGDVVDVRERAGSRSLQDGDLVLAHPVFDGAVFQIVGGIVSVTPHQRGRLVGLLDEHEGAFAVADELARTRRDGAASALSTPQTSWR